MRGRLQLSNLVGRLLSVWSGLSEDNDGPGMGYKTAERYIRTIRHFTHMRGCKEAGTRRKREEMEELLAMVSPSLL